MSQHCGKKFCELLKGAGYQVVIGKDIDEVIEIATHHKGRLVACRIEFVSMPSPGAGHRSTSIEMGVRF